MHPAPARLAPGSKATINHETSVASHDLVEAATDPACVP
jgi:hypothetical protein